VFFFFLACTDIAPNPPAEQPGLSAAASASACHSLRTAVCLPPSHTDMQRSTFETTALFALHKDREREREREREGGMERVRGEREMVKQIKNKLNLLSLAIASILVT